MREVSVISAGAATAAELMEILSQPADEHRADVGGRAHAAADRVRDEDLLGGAPRHVEQVGALLVRGGDVEEDELVGALAVVDGGELHRVARVTQVDEVHALDHAAFVDVQARDDALHEHRATPVPRRSRRRPRRQAPPRP